MNAKTTEEHISEAAEMLGAVKLGGGEYAYLAPETARWYVVSEADLADLGELLASDEPDVYSQWCAWTDSVEMSAADLYEAGLLDRTQVVALDVGEPDPETGTVEIEAEVELRANDWSLRGTLSVAGETSHEATRLAGLQPSGDSIDCWIYGDLASELPPELLVEIGSEVLALASARVARTTGRVGSCAQGG